MKFKIVKPKAGDIKSKLSFAFDWVEVEGYNVILGFYYKNYRYCNTNGIFLRIANTFKKQKGNLYDF
jgi:hypothetical protein